MWPEIPIYHGLDDTDSSQPHKLVNRHEFATNPRNKQQQQQFKSKEFK